VARRRRNLRQAEEKGDTRPLGWVGFESKKKKTFPRLLGKGKGRCTPDNVLRSPGKRGIREDLVHSWRGDLGYGGRGKEKKGSFLLRGAEKSVTNGGGEEGVITREKENSCLKIGICRHGREKGDGKSQRGI